MPHLNAWIEDEEGLGATVYWVSSATPHRRPSRQICLDYAQARQRVEREALPLPGLEGG